MARMILGPLMVILTACSGTEASNAMSGTPAAVEPAGPERIVSISTVATEMLFAIGAGDLVVAVDSMSNYPAEAPTTDLSGYQPNVEAILGFAPDLVVLSYDPGDVVAGLEAAGVTALLQGAAYALADTYHQITALGAITGNVDEAAALVADMQTEMAALAASVQERDEPLSYYHELDDTLYTCLLYTSPSPRD